MVTSTRFGFSRISCAELNHISFIKRFRYDVRYDCLLNFKIHELEFFYWQVFELLLDYTTKVDEMRTKTQNYFSISLGTTLMIYNIMYMQYKLEMSKTI